MISLSGSGAGWRWRRRLWVQRGVSGVIGHSRMWKARERRVHREQGPHTKGRAKGRELSREGGSEWVRLGEATEEERPRWEPKLTAQTLLIHRGFGCLWPPGVYTHLSMWSCQRRTVEPRQLQWAAHWEQKQQKHYAHNAAVTSGPHLTDMKLVFF